MWYCFAPYACPHKVSSPDAIPISRLLPVTAANELAMEALASSSSPKWPTNMLDTTTNEYCSRFTQIIGPAMHSCLLISPHIHSGAHDAPSSRLLMERVMPFENVNV